MQVEKSNIKTSAFGLAKGVQLQSEDSFDVKHFNNGKTVAVLCDGVGSAKEGREASQKVVNHIISGFENSPDDWDIPQTLSHLIKSINSILFHKSESEYGNPQMVTTLTAVIIEGNRLYGANVGDSRIYLVRDNNLKQLSLDHSLNGTNALTKAIGLQPEIEPYYFENNLKENDFILMASDGLYSELTDREIIDHMPMMANGLVKYLNRKVHENLRDDASAIILKFIENIEHREIREPLEIPENLNIGDEVDGYKLLKPLALNMRTWLVEKNNNKVVMKFPPASARESREELLTFSRETLYSIEINHKLFPRAYIPENRKYKYYLIEFLEGKNLLEYLNNNKFISTNDAIELLKILLEGSAYLLKRNLLHGDIKPENIIRLNIDGSFKIVDFGSIVEIFSLNSRAGTPSYLAPERFNNSPISESTEIFAIGVTIYKLLTDKFPYGEIEPFQNPTFHKNPEAPSKINRAVPVWLDYLILRMVHRDYKIRYKHFSEINYDLKHTENIKDIFSSQAPLLQRDPLKFYKIAFWSAIFLNIFQAIYK